MLNDKFVNAEMFKSHPPKTVQVLKVAKAFADIAPLC